MAGYRDSPLVKLDMLINGDPVDAFSVIIHRDKAYEWGRKIADKLKELIPRQLFEVAIQAAIGNKVIARSSVKALRKDVLAKARRRHLAQAQAPREAEGGEEAHEAGGRGRDPAGGVPRGAAGGERDASMYSTLHAPLELRPARARRVERGAWRNGVTSVVIQTAFLGDVILTTPLVVELARRGPVDVVTTPAAAPLLARNPDIRDVIVFDKRGSARGFAGCFASRRASAPVASTSPTSRRRRCAAPRWGRRRGCLERYLHRGRARALNTLRRVARRPPPRRAPGGSARAGEPAPDAAQLRPRLYPGDDERAAVDALLAPLAGEPFACLAPGSGYRQVRLLRPRCTPGWRAVDRRRRRPGGS